MRFDIHFIIVLIACFFLVWGIKNLVDETPEEDKTTYALVVAISFLLLMGEFVYSLRNYIGF